MSVPPERHLLNEALEQCVDYSAQYLETDLASDRDVREYLKAVYPFFLARHDVTWDGDGPNAEMRLSTAIDAAIGGSHD